MSLVVWLPLTKDLRQQGISSVIATNSGATYSSTGGKLGGCYNFTTSSYQKIGFPYSLANYTEFTVCVWVKPISTTITGCLFTFVNPNDYWQFVITNGNNVGIRDNSTGETGSRKEYTLGSFVANTWTHLVISYDKGVVKIYKDGVLFSTNNTGGSAMNNYSGTNAAIGESMVSSSSYYFAGGVNDFRIYDHCLSPMEVKELSKGLVLHYPLSDNSIQSLNNCYAYPRFETSNSNGGWFHWGSSGHVGTYGQTTDTNYIFRNGQTYAHWVADGSSATKDYLLYQEPAFDGGLRSLVAICKEENSKPITNDICYATWNARNGGVANNSWTSIQSLGNGFYLCKCEGISQDGSNDLVGIYIKPGYKVYFSEVYLENNRSISSDMFFPTNIVYDCSGLCNNSILNTSATVSDDTAKYTHSTYFGEYNTPKTDLIDNSLLPALTNCTITWWEKNDTTRTLLLTGQTTSHYIAASDNNTYYHGTVNGTKTLYRDGVAGTYKCEAGVWHHYALVGVDISTWTALHLNSYGSYWYLKGLVSDLRIYATALSADDVKSLYQNSAYIDSSGNVYGAVHTEV